jgi:hypothetical protein
MTTIRKYLTAIIVIPTGSGTSDSCIQSASYLPASCQHRRYYCTMASASLASGNGLLSSLSIVRVPREDRSRAKKSSSGSKRYQACPSVEQGNFQNQANTVTLNMSTFHKICLSPPFFPRSSFSSSAGQSASLSTFRKEAIPHLQAELEAAVSVVERACQLCLNVRAGILDDGEMDEGDARLKKQDATPVTVADFGVQALISLGGKCARCFALQPLLRRALLCSFRLIAGARCDLQMRKKQKSGHLFSETGCLGAWVRVLLGLDVVLGYTCAGLLVQ